MVEREAPTLTIRKPKKHSPTLESLIMVEQTIKQNNGEFTRTEIWENLPRKMMYQTYKQAMDYFITLKKVILRGNKVYWISYPDTLETLLKQSKPA